MSAFGHTAVRARDGACGSDDGAPRGASAGGRGGACARRDASRSEGAASALATPGAVLLIALFLTPNDVPVVCPDGVRRGEQLVDFGAEGVARHDPPRSRNIGWEFVNMADPSCIWPSRERSPFATPESARNARCPSPRALGRGGTRTPTRSAVRPVAQTQTRTGPPGDARPTPPDPASGFAVGSARHDYERPRNRREERIREQHPRIGKLLLALSNDPQARSCAQTSQAQGSRCSISPEPSARASSLRARRDDLHQGLAESLKF
jgi:hypothetical protein